MSENENKVCPVSCKIEHHAMMFAFLAKHAIELCGEAGKDAILAGMTTYGNERGARMAANALAHGDELTTMTNQAYGEWKPDYAGQMDFGTLRPNRHFRLTLQNVHGVKHGKSITLPNMGNIIASM